MVPIAIRRTPAHVIVCPQTVLGAVARRASGHGLRHYARYAKSGRRRLSRVGPSLHHMHCGLDPGWTYVE